MHNIYLWVEQDGTKRFIPLSGSGHELKDNAITMAVDMAGEAAWEFQRKGKRATVRATLGYPGLLVFKVVGNGKILSQYGVDLEPK